MENNFLKRTKFARLLSQTIFAVFFCFRLGDVTLEVAGLAQKLFSTGCLGLTRVGLRQFLRIHICLNKSS
ncbi:MAG: hypothetical protein LBT86_08300 [Deltaproteobacteria bacterium]|nr:hypothetical protein [Deltaproteobacteria bacterium]